MRIGDGEGTSYSNQPKFYPQSKIKGSKIAMASDYPEGLYGLRVKVLGLIAKVLGVKFKVNGYPFGSRMKQPYEGPKTGLTSGAR